MHRAIAAYLLPLLTDATIKGSCILLVLTVIMAIFRRMSAATRYCLWFFGAMSLLLLPILQAGVPACHVLPRWPARADMHPVDINQTPFAIDLPSDSTDDAAMSRPVSVVNARSVAAHSHATAPRLQPRRTASPAERLMALWLAGMGICIAWLLLASLSLHRLRLRCTEMRDTVWLDLLEQLRLETGFRRSVVMLTTPSRMMPMTWGLWRTCILLPADSVRWPAQQRRAVLPHELSHAIRFDCLTGLMANLAFATQWYNPLVWLARHRLQIERERACDDRVVRSGVKASTYAELLLHISSIAIFPHRTTGALTLARPNGLEPRLRAILDPDRNRRTVAANSAIGMFCAAVLISLPLASGRAGDRVASDTVAATQPITPAEMPTTIPSTGAAELYASAAKLIRVKGPSNSSIDFRGNFPFSSAWMELARTSFIGNGPVLRLAHQARSIKDPLWPAPPRGAALPDGRPARDFMNRELNQMRAVANEVADAALCQHLEGDDAGAVETVKDLLWMATLSRQQPQDHDLNRRFVALGFDAVASYRKMLIAAWGRYTDDPADTRALQRPAVQQMIRQMLDQQSAEAQMADIEHIDVGDGPFSPRIGSQIARVYCDRCYAAISLACHLYRLDHQSWPDSLDQLVPAYLPSVPIDPWGDGVQQLGYVVIKDGIPGPTDRPLVYSRDTSKNPLSYQTNVPQYDFDDTVDWPKAPHKHDGQFRDIVGWIPDNRPQEGPATRPVP